MSKVALIARQMRFDNKAFWRNPPAAVFTVAFPLILLFILNLLAEGAVAFPGGRVDPATYYVASIVALSVVSACFVNLAMTLTFSRDQGVLKRVRGTPLPAWVFVTSRVMHAAVVALLLTMVVVTLGRMAFGVEVPFDKLPALVTTILVGAACFAALGTAITAFIPSAHAASPIVNAVVVPLYLLSGVVIPLGRDTPRWIEMLGNLFPIKHFLDALKVVFTPHTMDAAFPWGDLGVTALWGAVGLVVAIRYFSWEPRR